MTRASRLRLGPCFAAALAVAGFWLAHQRTNSRGLARPTVAEARPLPLPASPLGLTPEPAWLVRQAGALQLSNTQRRELAAVAADWERDTRADRDLVRASTGEVAGYLASGHGKLDPGAANARADDLSQLSARLAAARHAAWDRAWKLLTPEQQDKVRRLRRHAPLEMR